MFVIHYSQLLLFFLILQRERRVRIKVQSSLYITNSKDATKEICYPENLLYGILYQIYCTEMFFNTSYNINLTSVSNINIS